MDIEKLDKNFAVTDKIDRDQIEYIDAVNFDLYGAILDNGNYRRMPEEVAKSVSQNVYWINHCLADGRIRFATDSPYIAVCAYCNTIGRMLHFPMTGSAGMDLYSGKRYFGTFIPNIDEKNSFSAVIDLDGKMRDYTINLPLYTGIDKLYIGLKKGCKIKKAKPYRYTRPVVFYGSSITQGGCASQAGSSYEGIISRELNCDILNLGFSGNAKGEVEMAQYIASLDMSVFVLDYDHNATTVKDLQDTHERFFKIIRKAHPNLPIIMMTRPKPRLTGEEVERLEVVKTTYQNAINSGDKNVYFIPGNTVFPAVAKDMALVDNCHPNSCGFYFMAKALIPTLKKLLKSETV